MFLLLTCLATSLIFFQKLYAFINIHKYINNTYTEQAKRYDYNYI